MSIRSFYLVIYSLGPLQPEVNHSPQNIHPCCD